jgi:hypothetical protein
MLSNAQIGVSQTMRIDFESSGGFANLQLTYRANTDELPQELAEELLKLIESSGFFDLQPGEVASTSPGPPDASSYRLSLSEGRRRNSLSFNDFTAPAQLRPLLERLQKLAIDQRRKGKLP